MIILQHPGLPDYATTLAAMQRFTGQRRPDTPDELWFLEHAPVYTLGLSRRREHVLDPGGIAVVESDRGGQVTYHAPGQLIAYVLMDLRRAGMSIKSLVSRLEQSVIDFLGGLDIEGRRRKGAPGVYVDGRKIAALGLRVRRGCTYHGLALNVDLDLSPFAGINPCGYAGLEVTRLADLGIDWPVQRVTEALRPALLRNLDVEEAGSARPQRAASRSGLQEGMR